MHKIEIHSFGPIDHFEANIEALNILIGPQASGKSTISKLIFFFHSNRDDLLNLLLSEEIVTRPLFSFGNELRKKFVGYFGNPVEMRDFKVVYYYNSEKSITLNRNSRGLINITFSQVLKSEVNRIFNNMKVIRTQLQQSSVTEALDINFFNLQKRISEQSRDAINAIFEDSRTSIFIPAGRSLVSATSDHLEEVVFKGTDVLMKEFVTRLNSLKKHFSKSLKDLVSERSNYGLSIERSKVEPAMNTVNRILKGQYLAGRDGEKIFYNEKEFVRLRFASSGQQEVMWILLLIFIMILENTEVFLVIEEPEAHLYPVAQKELMSLIALLLNNSKNHVMITTHSPYVLTALNLHLYAGSLDKLMDARQRPVLEKGMRINPKGVTAVMLHDDGNGPEDIFDSELGLIKAEAIDRASDLINAEMNKLIDFEVLE